MPKNLINLIQCPNSVNQEGVAIRMISIAKYHFYILENEIKGYSSNLNRKDFGLIKLPILYRLPFLTKIQFNGFEKYKHPKIITRQVLKEVKIY